jgi:prepilin-type processing-associated H-X9-DG protein
MLLQSLEQGALFSSVNFSLVTTDPGSQTVRTASLSVFLCPSNTGASGPLTIRDGSGNILVSDLSPGQYVAVAGQLEPEEFPSQNNGLFFRNSRIGIRDITDGTSATLMAGERSQNVANATWVGMIPSGQSCNNPKWLVQDCEASNVLILGHTGPSPDENWVDTPNYKKAGVDDFHSLHRGGCNFLFADGSIRFVKETINPQVFSYLATRAGGEVVGEDQF